MRRAVIGALLALGLAVAGLGYALWYFIGVADSNTGQLQQQRQLIGALQHQVTDLGGKPLTHVPRSPSAHPIPQPTAAVAPSAPEVEVVQPRSTPTARPRETRSTSPRPTSRPSHPPTHSPSPKPSPSLCPLGVVCISPPPLMIGTTRHRIQESNGMSVQTIGQVGLIVVSFGAVGVARRRK